MSLSSSVRLPLLLVIIIYSVILLPTYSVAFCPIVFEQIHAFTKNTPNIIKNIYI